ncbi:MAG: alpha/beta hydrolase [Pseudomonas sp.]
MKIFTLIIALFLTLSLPLAAWGEREATMCGAIKERLMFTLWHWHTPKADPQRAAAHPDIEPTEFVTSDGKTLRGLRYIARDPQLQGEAAKGYLLLAMGNGMVADQMVVEMQAYAEAGYDVYVFDYRGYGRSEGRRRLGAIIADYREVVEHLNQRYDRALLYGTSFGGIVVMNVIGQGALFDAAVVDSSPSRLSEHGCPVAVDPIEHLSEEQAGRLLVITGDRDTVLDNSMIGALREEAARMGLDTYRGRDLAHPFMDSPAAHARRTALIREHLLVVD